MVAVWLFVFVGKINVLVCKPCLLLMLPRSESLLHPSYTTAGVRLAVLLYLLLRRRLRMLLCCRYGGVLDELSRYCILLGRLLLLGKSSIMSRSCHFFILMMSDNSA